MLLNSNQAQHRRRSARKGSIAAAILSFALTTLSAAMPVRAQTPELRPAGNADSKTSGKLATNVPQAPPAVPSTLPPSQSPGAKSVVTQTKPQAPKPDDAPKIPLAEALERSGDLICRNMTMDAAIFAIRETWKINIVTGKEMQGTVNGVFTKTPLREVLDAILLANGYSYRVIGESLVIQPSQDVGFSNPLFRSVTLPVEHGSIEEIVEGATLLKSSTGQVKPFPRTRSIMVVDYADRVEAITAFVRNMDAAASGATGGTPVQFPTHLDVAYFHTHFIPVDNAKQPLLSVLSPMGRVATMPRENRLIVVDFPANLEMARKVMDRLDRPRPQVRITALIYDISLQDVEKLGLNWGTTGKGGDLDADGNAKQALQFETSTLAPFASGEAGGTLTVRSLTRNFDINTILQLIQNANDARLVANPNVTVVDNELAEWKSVSEIPYQQITQSELGGQIGTTAFKEAGITLRVQPQIAGDGTIEMMVEPEFSRLAGFTPTEDQPILDTRKATTRVRVANRQTIVLSGLRQRSDTGEFNGIPFLKDVKYVGNLFRSRNTNVRESELIVFIMPEIICYDDAPGAREYQALETINCRLNGVPYAEGCQPPGCFDGCPAGEVLPLPPIDETAPAEEPQAPTAPPTTVDGTSSMRPPYDARFRADNATGLRTAQKKQAAPKPDASKQKPPMWKRLFGS
jgi:general secretion pathway protein D